MGSRRGRANEELIGRRHERVRSQAADVGELPSVEPGAEKRPEPRRRPAVETAERHDPDQPPARRWRQRRGILRGEESLDPVSLG